MDHTILKDNEIESEGCWDNAAVESFFETLKRELVDGCVCRSHEEARKAIFEYVEVYDNRRRWHSSLGYLTPLTYGVRAKVFDANGHLLYSSSPVTLPKTSPSALNIPVR